MLLRVVLSGFHSLVGSEVFSKQLTSELDALIVRYGGMLTEAFLATLVVATLENLQLSGGLLFWFMLGSLPQYLTAMDI